MTGQSHKGGTDFQSGVLIPQKNKEKDEKIVWNADIADDDDVHGIAPRGRTHQAGSRYG